MNIGLDIEEAPCVDVPRKRGTKRYNLNDGGEESSDKSAEENGPKSYFGNELLQQGNIDIQHPGCHAGPD